MLWVSLRVKIQASDDGNTMWRTSLRLWRQPVCTLQYKHPGVNLEEEVPKHCLSLCAWGMRKGWMAYDICKYELECIRSPNKGSTCRGQTEEVCTLGIASHLWRRGVMKYSWMTTPKAGGLLFENKYQGDSLVSINEADHGIVPWSHVRNLQQ